MQHNEWKAANGRVIKLIGPDVLVRLHKNKETTSGGIVIPDTVGDRGDEGILVKGTILAFGFFSGGGEGDEPFYSVPIPGLEVGLTAVFIRYYAEQHSNQQLQYRFEEGVIRLKPLDIMLVFDPQDDSRVLA